MYDVDNDLSGWNEFPHEREIEERRQEEDEARRHDSACYDLNEAIAALTNLLLGNTPMVASEIVAVTKTIGELREKLRTLTANHRQEELF